ncbi:MAG TPA: hypothetical protein VFE47_04435 [Tepidisphaeraceae bacterium]|jgi:hypothetical protein|nr:hypothetical protein [Tepidisphaeraceae bacterium]
MPQTIQFQSRVGSDRTLEFHVPLQDMEPGDEVLVTIRRLAPDSPARRIGPAEWHRFVEETYGSCADLGMERLPQGEFEKREAIE